MEPAPAAPVGDASSFPQDAPMPDMNGGQDMPPMNGEEGVPPIDGENTPADNPEDDSTMGIINQLSPEDKKAVRSYAESMLARDETQETPEEEPAPMGESVRFTKKQIEEVFNELEKEKKSLSKKTKVSKKSPFNNPKFE